MINSLGTPLLVSEELNLEQVESIRGTIGVELSIRNVDVGIRRM